LEGKWQMLPVVGTFGTWHLPEEVLNKSYIDAPVNFFTSGLESMTHISEERFMYVEFDLSIHLCIKRVCQTLEP